MPKFEVGDKVIDIDLKNRGMGEILKSFPEPTECYRIIWSNGDFAITSVDYLQSYIGAWEIWKRLVNEVGDSK